jgi:hypothetical protein
VVPTWTEASQAAVSRDGSSLLNPPLRAVTSLDRLIAAIENHDDTELKLEGIASRKRSVEHINGMVKGDVL